MPSSASPEIYTVSLHDALPIWIVQVICQLRHDDAVADVQLRDHRARRDEERLGHERLHQEGDQHGEADEEGDLLIGLAVLIAFLRSEEHTSELQSLRHLVCRLLRHLRSTPFPYTTLFRSGSCRSYANFDTTTRSPMFSCGIIEPDGMKNAWATNVFTRKAISTARPMRRGTSSSASPC